MGKDVGEEEEWREGKEMSTERSVKQDAQTMTLIAYECLSVRKYMTTKAKGCNFIMTCRSLFHNHH